VSGVPLPSLGRAVTTGRHRPVSPDQDPQAPGRELENYLAALAPETEMETTGSGRRFGNSQVYQLRLQLIADQQLRELAEQNGTSPAALAQEWVVQRLKWEANQRTAVPSWP
jgi:aryl-alcohol dehydrogenase-like predicted oxidoreductase